MTFRMPQVIGLLVALILAVPSRMVAAATVDLTIDPTCGFPRLGITGTPGDAFSVEGSDDPTGALWQPMLDFTLEAGGTSWCDSEAHGRSRRFYRAIRFDAPPPQLRPRNFRLLDNTGKAKELYYDFNNPLVAGYVLVFVGESVSNALPILPQLKALSAAHAKEGIRFWVVSSWSGNRSNLVAEAKSYNVTFPVLHDSAGIVGTEFGVTQVPEVILLSNASFEVLYRGAVEEQQSGGVAHYLENALQQFVSARQVNPSRVRALGKALPSRSSAGVPDYVTEIAPLLQERCVSCHSPGNIAPWSMTNHAIVEAYGDSIKDEILSARMPPWHADPTVGSFSNDSSLRPEESDRLMRWLNAGAPRGSGEDPLTTHIPESVEWPLGTPDIILSIPEQSLPDFGDVDYRYITVNPKLTADTWVKAAVVKPGNRKVVHHSLIFLGDVTSSLNGLAGYFAGYVPGLDASLFPTNTGKLLPKNTLLTFQMHYISIGTPQTDRTQLGLYLLKTPPAQKLLTKAAFDVFFDIPAGVSEFTTTATSTPFTKNSLIWEISPHQHLRGKWFNYDLQLLNGTTKPLIRIPRYVFNWQRLYRFTEPIVAPAGSRIVCTGAWDNSLQNLDNPDPSTHVQFGEQTYEEMFIGYYNYSE